MASGTETAVATFVALLVTASLPCYLYGAWIILSHEVVTWRVLVRHLRFILLGLALTTIPILAWMLPRLDEQFQGPTVLHAFLGLQAYALLVFGLTGIVRIVQVKRRHDLYHDPDPDVDIGELHEDMGVWRRRLRVGVFGYLGFWVLAWLVGLWWYVSKYWGPPY